MLCLCQESGTDKGKEGEGMKCKNCGHDIIEVGGRITHGRYGMPHQPDCRAILPSGNVCNCMESEEEAGLIKECEK